MREQPQAEDSGQDVTFEQVYEELRGLARRAMRFAPKGHTLQPSALVHEAYLKICRATDLRDTGRGTFLRMASRAMQEVLVDHARRRKARKRGGDWERVSLAGLSPADSLGGVDLLALQEALGTLEVDHPRPALIVRLRFFCGMEEREAAEALSLSRTTVQGEWRFARAWLQRSSGRFARGTWRTSIGSALQHTQKTPNLLSLRRVLRAKATGTHSARSCAGSPVTSGGARITTTGRV